MTKEGNISEIISNCESIKVLVTDISDNIPLDDQYRLQAVYVLADVIISKTNDSY